MEKITCPKCAAVIGEIVEIEGIGMLKIGNLIVRSIRCYCECGYVFHWETSDRILSKLIERVKNGQTALR